MPAIRGANSKKKTRRYKRDLDQIHSDLKDPKHLAQFKDTKAAEDLPAGGQFYCIECAKWFEQETNYSRHLRGSTHKKRVRQLREDQHTHKSGEEAVGLFSDNGKRSNVTSVMDTDLPVADGVPG